MYNRESSSLYVIKDNNQINAPLKMVYDTVESQNHTERPTSKTPKIPSKVKKVISTMIY